MADELPTGTFIQFVHFRSTKRTKLWEVRKISTGTPHPTARPDVLGVIKWYSNWRCYTFRPEDDCIFNALCLTEIAAFCQSATVRHNLLVKTGGNTTA